MASAAQFSPDYEEYYLQERFSDVQLIITEEEAAEKKRRRKNTQTEAQKLPGHSMVLLAFSKYCKTKLENWVAPASSSSSSKPEVVIPVPAGQQDLAKLMVQGMYQAQPKITDSLSHQQLLQLMLLADLFEVPKVQAAVLAAFKAVSVKQLDWQTTLQLLDLPLSCAQQEDFAAIQGLAQQRLQQDLGDVELAWNDERLARQLQQLPFHALLQLLQHDETRVASENTVVWTVQRWMEHHKAGCSKSDANQLLQQVRIRHCTTLFISTVMTQCAVVAACFSAQELGFARECCSPDGFDLLQRAKSPVLQKYPAWSAGKRPASTMQQQIEWRVPLSELQVGINLLLCEASRTSVWCSSSKTVVLQGQPLQLKLQVSSVIDTADSSSDSTRRSCFAGLFLGLLDLPNGSVRRVTFKATAVAAAVSSAAALAAALAAAPAAPMHVSMGPTTSVVSQQALVWGWEQQIALGSVGSWQQVEQALRDKGLAHAAGADAATQHLLFRADVIELV